MSPEEIAKSLLVKLRESDEFHRGLTRLRRRGLSREVIDIMRCSEDVRLVRAALDVTYTPPPRKGLSRRWWRLRTALGATDPHDTRRAEVAGYIADLNASAHLPARSSLCRGGDNGGQTK